jgi:hypothetical protein
MGTEPTDSNSETPGTLLDSLRAHPEWSERQREAVVERIVARFPGPEVAAAVGERLDNLSGADAETLLRLVEAFPTHALHRALAEGVENQPDLPPERVWDALAVLDGAGVLSGFPRLADMFMELNELLGDDDVVGDLVEQIEGDPDGVWLALQGLGAIEREIRPSIIEGLARETLGPGLVEFARLLAFAHDPETRSAAVGLLTEAHEGVDEALHDLAAYHPDPALVASLKPRIYSSRRPIEAPAAPRMMRSVVSAIDGRGRGTVVLGALRGRDHVTAVFACDVASGIHDVFGDVARSPIAATSAFDELATNLGPDLVENDHPLALGMLAASLTLCGPDTAPALRYWLEATAGKELRPQPFPAGPPDWNPSSVPFEEIPGRVQDVLDACPSWRDASPLTFEMAEEILLRERSATVDPRRDAGAFRFLFEHQLKTQLERYRRMLLWMAGLWRSADDEELARSALTLAWQLADAQHVVPGHPFAVALMTRSLTAAQDALGRGVDARATGGGKR